MNWRHVDKVTNQMEPRRFGRPEIAEKEMLVRDRDRLEVRGYCCGQEVKPNKQLLKMTWIRWFLANAGLREYQNCLVWTCPVCGDWTPSKEV